MRADFCVSLKEMYVCELVHVSKINKRKLEKVPRNKSLLSAPPNIQLSFLNHTQISHVAFWGL